MSKAHAGSILAIKNIPVPLDDYIDAYFNFNQSLTSLSAQIYPEIHHMGSVEYPHRFDKIMVDGKHSNGIHITDYVSDPESYPTYLFYQLEHQPKTISFWFKSTSDKIVDHSVTPALTDKRHLLVLSKGKGMDEVKEDGVVSGEFLSCLITHSNDTATFPSGGGTIALWLYDGVSKEHTCEIDKTKVDPLDGTWHFITIEINVPSIKYPGKYCCRLWIDGESEETESSGSTPSGYDNPANFGSLLSVGNGYGNLKSETDFGGETILTSDLSSNSTAMSECIYDDLCIRNRHYQEDEMLQWYHSNREFYIPYDYSFTLSNSGYDYNIKNFGTYRAWDDGTYAKSAWDYRHPQGYYSYSGDTGSGTYRIQLDDGTLVDVYCDMSTDGGGWMMVVSSLTEEATVFSAADALSLTPKNSDNMNLTTEGISTIVQHISDWSDLLVYTRDGYKIKGTNMNKLGLTLSGYLDEPLPTAATSTTWRSSGIGSIAQADKMIEVSQGNLVSKKATNGWEIGMGIVHLGNDSNEKTILHFGPGYVPQGFGNHRDGYTDSKMANHYSTNDLYAIYKKWDSASILQQHWFIR